MKTNKISSISHADSLEKMGEFWDTHDFTDYDEPEAPDIEFNITEATHNQSFPRHSAGLLLSV